MIILISGTTHTGKTALSQRLMEKYKIPYFSIDHLKMGLIRSNKTSLTADDDEKFTPYLTRIDSRKRAEFVYVQKVRLGIYLN